MLEEETNTLAIVGTPAGLGKLFVVRAAIFEGMSYVQ